MEIKKIIKIPTLGLMSASISPLIFSLACGENEENNLDSDDITSLINKMNQKASTITNMTSDHNFNDAYTKLIEGLSINDKSKISLLNDPNSNLIIGENKIKIKIRGLTKTFNIKNVIEGNKTAEARIINVLKKQSKKTHHLNSNNTFQHGFDWLKSALDNQMDLNKVELSSNASDFLKRGNNLLNIKIGSKVIGVVLSNVLEDRNLTFARINNILLLMTKNLQNFTNENTISDVFKSILKIFNSYDKKQITLLEKNPQAKLVPGTNQITLSIAGQTKSYEFHGVIEQINF